MDSNWFSACTTYALEKGEVLDSFPNTVLWCPATWGAILRSIYIVCLDRHCSFTTALPALTGGAFWVVRPRALILNYSKITQVFSSCPHTQNVGVTEWDRVGYLFQRHIWHLNLQISHHNFLKLINKFDLSSSLLLQSVIEKYIVSWVMD